MGRWRELDFTPANRTFYRLSELSTIRTLAEQRVDDLATEFEMLWREHRKDFRPWYESHGPVEGWRVFGTHVFGQRLDGNCVRAPAAAAFAEALPGTTLCGYSVLLPGAHIEPHAESGESAAMRVHVGLRVPNGGLCGVRVGQQVRIWREGSCLAFLSTAEHEAWNFSNAIRVVLLLDTGAAPLPWEQWPQWLQEQIPAKDVGPVTGLGPDFP